MRARAIEVTQLKHRSNMCSGYPTVDHGSFSFSFTRSVILLQIFMVHLGQVTNAFRIFMATGTFQCYITNESNTARGHGE